MNKIFIIIICIIICFFTIIYPTYAIEPIGNKIYEGIDVSAWQGIIDYEKVKSDGVEIVYIKASEGNGYVDPYFENNYQKAKKSELYVGVYHYLTARNIKEAEVQAQFFVSVIGGKNIDCKLAMDFESFEGLAEEEVNKIGVAFLNKVKELSKKDVIIYSDTYNATNIFKGTITSFPLWVAQYYVKEPSYNGNWNNWVGFQYTDKGVVSGIVGNVDKDRFTNEVFLDDTKEIPVIEPPEPVKQDTKTKQIVIQYGDTLSEIAIKYNTTVQKLVEINNIKNPNLIYAGEILLVPMNNNAEIGSDIIYIVKKGDTLWNIAKVYDTTVSQIVRINNIKNPNYIYAGQRIIIPTHSQLIYNKKNYVLYKIRYGDTLYSISRRYNTSIANIVRLNRIQNPNLIYAGEIIKI